ncbi:hypothetical protein FS800_23135 [Agrobacterium vitis]|uniref:phage tail terminator protein n=1 Tax=Allorhizobium ampelinum TaxID=3025782 RepID=UPI001F43123D|nr:hypothetical protein [Allorhizobium ampelinum]MCF1485026.1 hypothetical protein [Allorhizobium ampelinum]
MIVFEVMDRLKQTETPFVLVEGANELAQVTDRPTNTPAAYVFVSGEASGENQRVTGPMLQRMSMDISVVIVTENAAGAENAARDIETLKAWVRGKLLGFTPTEAEPLEHITGKLQQARDGMVWFEDVFGTAVFQEEKP